MKFTDEMDIQLFHEILQDNPYCAEKPEEVWEKIAERLLEKYVEVQPDLTCLLTRTLEEQGCTAAVAFQKR